MSKQYLRAVWGVVAFAMFAVFASPVSAQSDGADTESRSHPNPMRYRITIENLTGGQPFTPPVVVTHNSAADVFSVGEHASPGIQGLAENGDVPGLVGSFDGIRRVSGVTVAGDGPLLGGESVTVEVEAPRGHRRLSIASMLICTNDGFTGLDSLRTPGVAGKQAVTFLRGYDAGTEINTEDFDDLVPPCGPLTGVDSGGAGTGATNPALAEGGVITVHPGIAGSDDLDPAIHDWDDPVAKVTVTRIDNARKYEVTVTNNTTGQPLTPPVFASHNYAVDLFDVGAPASAAIQGVAENGDVPGLVTSLENVPRGMASLSVGAGPVLPGESQTLDLYGARWSRFVSFASMLICTNDGFTGIDQLRLPGNVGDTVSIDTRGYDAGTEINTEDFDDIVPPCGPLTGVDSGGAGTGATNPALAEGGVIAHHPGISGGYDLVPSIHDWDDPTVTVTITRVQ